MLRTRRDVDRHVEQLEAKIQSEAERGLKALSIAKLYYNVREYETALKYAQKYSALRPASSSAFKTLGQIHEAVGDREKALTAYRSAFEVDRAGQKELILKAAEMMAPMVKCADNNDKDVVNKAK